jgi:hypothetical protein
MPTTEVCRRGLGLETRLCARHGNLTHPAACVSMSTGG